MFLLIVTKQNQFFNLLSLLHVNILLKLVFSAEKWHKIESDVSEGLEI